MLPKVGLNPKAFASVAGNMKGAYVRGPSGNNAIPGMVMGWYARQAIIKTMRFAHIDRMPSVIRIWRAKNVDARAELVGDADAVDFGLVLRAACSEPNHARRQKKGVQG